MQLCPHAGSDLCLHAGLCSRCRRGQVEVQGCPAEFYAPVLEVLEQMGCRVERTAQGVVVSRFGKLRGVGRGVYRGCTLALPPMLRRCWPHRC